MNEKIRVNIYVDKYAWEELPKYIACSKSNWINEQILKKISQHDDVADLERKINEITALVEGLQFDKENLEARKKELLDERKRNEQSFEIINNAMNTIRIVNENQGYIIPPYQMATLDEIQDDLTAMKEAYRNEI